MLTGLQHHRELFNNQKIKHDTLETPPFCLLGHIVSLASYQQTHTSLVDSFFFSWAVSFMFFFLSFHITFSVWANRLDFLHRCAPPPTALFSVTSQLAYKVSELRAQTRQMDTVGLISTHQTNYWKYKGKGYIYIYLYTNWSFTATCGHGYWLFHRGAAYFVPHHECGFI